MVESSDVVLGGTSWFLYMAFQGDSIYWVEVEKVVPNPFQPRREFDQNKLQELAESIRMYGVLQPLTVTRSEVQRDDGTFYTEYELIAGERRLRASKLAGVAQVPVIIREGEQNEQEKLELAIIENLQREDLNAVDRALAFKQLAEVFNLSHALVAKKVGRSREYVSNSIRLLGLPEHMLESLKRSEMMEGHARTLLMLTDRPEEQEVVYKEILLKKLSVREVERIVRKIATDKVRKKNPGEFDASLIEFEKQFTETLGTRVQIQKTDFGGKLTIDYFSEDDLETILKRIRDEVAADTVEAKPVSAAAHLAAHTPLEMTAEPEVKSVPEPTPVAPEPSVTPEPRVESVEPAPTALSAEVETPVVAHHPEPVNSAPEAPAQPWLPRVTSPEPVVSTPDIPASPAVEPVSEVAPKPWAPSSVSTVSASAASERSEPTPTHQSHNFARSESAAPLAVPSYGVTAAPKVEPMPAVPPHEVAPVAEPKAADTDDSDLYSMKNFSI